MMVDYGYSKQLMYGKPEVCAGSIGGKFDLSALTSESRSSASSASSSLLNAVGSTSIDGRPSPHCPSDCSPLLLSSNSSTGSASTTASCSSALLHHNPHHHHNPNTSSSASSSSSSQSIVHPSSTIASSLHSPASSLETCVVSTSMHSQLSSSGVNALTHSNNLNNVNLANNSKQKRHRTRFTPAQLQELEVNIILFLVSSNQIRQIYELPKNVGYIKFAALSLARLNTIKRAHHQTTI